MSTSTRHFQYSMSSKAHGPAIISHQQPHHPGMVIRPLVEERVQGEAERIRGGCCPCPGGNVWVLSPSSMDDGGSMEQELMRQTSPSPAPSSAAGTPAHDMVAHPQLQVPPLAKQGGRQATRTLPPQSNPLQYHREGPRATVQSTPTRPYGHAKQ